MNASAACGHDIFLGEHLDRIGDRLQQTENAGPVGSEADLQPGQQLALQPYQIAGRQQQTAQHDGDLD